MMTPEQQQEFQRQYIALAETRTPGRIIVSDEYRWQLIFRGGRAQVTPLDALQVPEIDTNTVLPF